MNSYFKNQYMFDPNPLEQYEITENQKIIEKLDCNTGTCSLNNNNLNNNLTNNLNNNFRNIETYDGTSHHWLYWLIFILILIFLYLLYRRTRYTPLSPDTIRSILY